ncbi:MAG: hypothetical protein IJD91_06100 [Clostridia bacterium]|nr:hypothetical protein [Clostridia bacterium]
MEDFILGLVIGCATTAFIIGTLNIPEVEPIDVYRGKTTLEITYRDSVAIDSTVVYKVR